MSFLIAATRFVHLLQMIHHVREEFLHRTRRSISIRCDLHIFDEVNKHRPSASLINTAVVPERSMQGAVGVP